MSHHYCKVMQDGVRIKKGTNNLINPHILAGIIRLQYLLSCLIRARLAAAVGMPWKSHITVKSCIKYLEIFGFLRQILLLGTPRRVSVSLFPQHG
jgi:hypothetical protein